MQGAKMASSYRWLMLLAMLGVAMIGVCTQQAESRGAEQEEVVSQQRITSAITHEVEWDDVNDSWVMHSLDVNHNVVASAYFSKRPIMQGSVPSGLFAKVNVLDIDTLIGQGVSVSYCDLDSGLRIGMKREREDDDHVNRVAILFFDEMLSNAKVITTYCEGGDRLPWSTRVWPEISLMQAMQIGGSGSERFALIFDAYINDLNTRQLIAVYCDTNRSHSVAVGLPHGQAEDYQILPVKCAYVLNCHDLPPFQFVAFDIVHSDESEVYRDTGTSVSLISCVFVISKCGGATDNSRKILQSVTFDRVGNANDVIVSDIGNEGIDFYPASRRQVFPSGGLGMPCRALNE